MTDSFLPTPLSNRVDTAGTPNSIVRYRMLQITTDSGGTISVTYSTPECVAGSNMPASPDTNTKRCFPAYWIPPGATTPKLEYFHKYRVDQVAAGDQVDSTDADQVTTYTYVGAPAWHFTDSGIAKPERRTWDQWRGYQTVRTVSGASTGTQSEVDTTYFRGLDGDKTATGTRSASVPDSDGGSWADSDWFAGTPRETITLNGPGGAVVGKTKNDPYVFGPTASQDLNGIALRAYVTDTAVSTTKTALDGNRGWRTTRTTTGFVADRTGRVSQVDDEGDVSTTAEDRCTRTTYAADTAGTMLALVSRVETVAVRCAATPDRSKDVISDVRTWYDGATSYGTTVSRGDATRVENLTGYSGSTPQYAQASRATYDTYGRTVQSYDELDHLTRTGYTGTPVTRTVVTDPKGYATTSDIDPAWGLPLATTDANARRTDLAYDGLGRLTGVWLPGRDKASQLADQRFGYDAHGTGGPSVAPRPDDVHLRQRGQCADQQGRPRHHPRLPVRRAGPAGRRAADQRDRPAAGRVHLRLAARRARQADLLDQLRRRRERLHRRGFGLHRAVPADRHDHHGPGKRGFAGRHVHHRDHLQRRRYGRDRHRAGAHRHPQLRRPAGRDAAVRLQTASAYRPR